MLPGIGVHLLSEQEADLEQRDKLVAVVADRAIAEARLDAREPRICDRRTDEEIVELKARVGLYAEHLRASAKGSHTQGIAGIQAEEVAERLAIGIRAVAMLIDV